MDILITGCERSGTKMMLQRYEKQDKLQLRSEYKPTTAFYKGYCELVKYGYDTAEWLSLARNTLPKGGVEKHSLNLEQNLDFLKFIKQLFPDVLIKYMHRDPVANVQSQVFKIWNTSTKEANYTKSVDHAILQWQSVYNTCYDWALENGIVVKYEDHCENNIVLPEPLVMYIKSKVS